MASVTSPAAVATNHHICDGSSSIPTASLRQFVHSSTGVNAWPNKSPDNSASIRLAAFSTFWEPRYSRMVKEVCFEKRANTPFFSNSQLLLHSFLPSFARGGCRILENYRHGFREANTFFRHGRGGDADASPIAHHVRDAGVPCSRVHL